MIHFGRGVRITQSIVQSCAEKLKKDFPTSSNLGRRWVETFITKKGYTYKRIRGSKELIPNADIELCRNEIRQKTKNTVQEIVSTSMKRDITHIVVKIILIKLMKAGFQIKRGELYHDSWAMTHGPWLIEQYGDQTDQPDEDDLDSVIDDQTPTPSQNMANELLTLNLNDSRSEYTESITKSQNLKQSSISSYFHKK